MTDNIRRLYRDYAHSMKWWIHEPDVWDNEYLVEFFSTYPTDALKNHYASGRLTLDEFEFLVGLSIGLERVELPAGV